MNVNPKIEVFVPGYNVERFIDRCLSSIFEQTYPYFDVLMIDDASTDKTGTLMDEASRRYKFRESLVMHNETNQKMPRNLEFLRVGNPDNVIVIVDADDYLFNLNVFTIIADEYLDPDLWLMYGSYTREDPRIMPNPALPFPPDVIANRSFRKYSATNLVYNHPITFRRRLLQNIEDWEMQSNGEWFTAAYDHVIMMPMLEMSAPDHFKWCPEILYVYNEDNELSEAKRDRSEGITVHNVVNSRPKRDQL